MEDWIKAGEIAKKSLEFGRSLIKDKILLLKVAEKIEAKIVELGGKPAFPVNLSKNHLAAHFTPSFNDTEIYEEDDLLKIDVGVHVNGCVGDTACTIGNNKELILASKEALDEAIKVCKIGVEVKEIGAVIHDKITEFGFSPIKNLSGHKIEKFNLHSGLTIPNFDNGSNLKLSKNDIIAIEPFATTGKGAITEGKLAGIYKLVEKKPIRNQTARKVLDFIIKEYSTLPFAQRWIVKKFGVGSKLALLLLEREDIIKQYNQLPEVSKAPVSQAEHTILIKEKIKVLTG